MSAATTYITVEFTQYRKPWAVPDARVLIGCDNATDADGFTNVTSDIHTLIKGSMGRAAADVGSRVFFTDKDVRASMIAALRKEVAMLMSQSSGVTANRIQVISHADYSRRYAAETIAGEAPDTLSKHRIGLTNEDLGLAPEETLPSYSSSG